MPRNHPNILFVMADQLAPQALPCYGHSVVKAPRIDQIANDGVLFDNAYCNFPICAPARFAMLSGRLATRIGAFDNAAEFPASMPTFVHHLRDLGYVTALSGKMHFIGPDQLHGFEERLTTDIYQGDFYYTPNWLMEDAYLGQLDSTFSNADGHQAVELHTLLECSGGGADEFLHAGMYPRTLNKDFDDELTHQATRWLWNYARGNESRPFFLTVGLINPHDPYMATPPYWERYDHDSIDLPLVPPIAPERRDELSRRHYYMTGMHEAELTSDHLRSIRHAYYGQVSYVDNRVGDLLDALKGAGLADNTIVIVTGDHGEMLGERGMLKKMCFFEPAVRVPLIIHAPTRFNHKRVSQNVSLVDLFATVLDLATDGKSPELSASSESASFFDLLNGDDDNWHDTVLAEYTDVGAGRPWFMVKEGDCKLITDGDAASQLYDLALDPNECSDRSADPQYRKIKDRLAHRVAREWDAEALKREVMDSQKSRQFIKRALGKGKVCYWDFQPVVEASQQYVRSHTPYQEICDGYRRMGVRV